MINKLASGCRERWGLAGGIFAFVLGGCAQPLMQKESTYDRVQDTLTKSMQRKKETAEPINPALLPPAQLDLPKSAQSIEPRFDLAVNAAPASQVFMALVSGTRYSMLLPPDLTGSLTLNLKNVTVREALESIRDLYGYEFSVQGTRITIQPNTLQSRIYQVSYLASKRSGATSTRVSSSSSGGGAAAAGSGAGGAGGTGGGTGGGGYSGGPGDSINIYTGQMSDFWAELEQSLALMLNCDYDLQRATSASGGSYSAALVAQSLSQRMDKLKCPEGRTFIINHQSGVVMVRAMPAELREVSRLLKSLQAGVERQVMLEAKIIEVALSDNFQSGINWAALDASGRPRWSMNANPDNLGFPPSIPAGSTLGGTFGILKGFDAGGPLGLAFQTNSFASLIDFLSTQGTVYVMSNPRIATLNNQKAVLKVGNDDYYITAVTPPSTNNNAGTTTTNPPSITTQPFFSGIALDVTPQIDEAGNITLHIRPAVTEVSERNKVINFGDLGTYTLPYASSKVKESDSIVRVRDGMIVAIGGLMSQEQNDTDAKVPGAGDVPLLGMFFKQAKAVKTKRELVILLKPTVIRSEAEWDQDLADTQERMRELDPRQWPKPAKFWPGTP